MDVRKIAEKGLILKFPVGSKLYGTDTPESDEDFCGVFVAPPQFYLGLQTVNEVDFSVVSKKDNGRNDKNAIDFKVYELRKFVKLAMENNPNILEMLFIPKNKLLFSTTVGQRLLDNRHIFPHSGVKQKFLGYAFSQKKKMLVKRDNMNALKFAQELFQKVCGEGFGKDYIAEHLSGIKGRWSEAKFPWKDNQLHIQIGDIHIQKNITIAKALEQINGRVDRFSGRHADFVSKHGYDTKFGSHLFRLMDEGEEFLTTGKVEFPLRNAELIKEIKAGKFTVEEVLEMAEEREARIEKLYEEKKFIVPKGPCHAEIEELLIALVLTAWEEIWNYKVDLMYAEDILWNPNN